MNVLDIHLDYFQGSALSFFNILAKKYTMEDRRAFIKKVSCITGACLFGFTSLVQTATATENVNAPVPNPNESLMQDWISNLLFSINQKADKATHRTIM